MTSTLWPDYAGYEPLPELKGPPGSIITLLFILPRRIYYEARSDDAIFSATEAVFIDGLNRTYWKGARITARVLACTDHARWRSADDGVWHNLDGAKPPVDDLRVVNGWWMMFFSLLHADTYTSLKTRNGLGLNATSRVRGTISAPLDEEQWKTEVKQIYETSLARMLVEAYNVARGTYGRYEGYEKVTHHPRTGYPNYLFVVQGWTNIDADGYFWILGVSLVIIIVAIPATKGRLWPELLCRGHEGRVASLFISLVLQIRSMIWDLVKKLVALPKKTYNGLIRVGRWFGRELVELRR